VAPKKHWWTYLYRGSMARQAQLSTSWTLRGNGILLGMRGHKQQQPGTPKCAALCNPLTHHETPNHAFPVPQVTNSIHIQDVHDGVKVEASSRVDDLLGVLYTQACDLTLNDQQHLLVDIASLASLVTANGWKHFIPAVPIDLLNHLLVSVSRNIRSFDGMQVGQVLQALHRLKLRDSHEFATMFDTIAQVLRTPGRNASYQRTDAIAGIVQAVVGILQVCLGRRQVQHSSFALPVSRCDTQPLKSSCAPASSHSSLLLLLS
jgi:hypothetical protein